MPAKDDKIGALWARKSNKTGNEYWTGKVGDVQVVIFPNGYKEKESQPDFIVYKSEDRRES